MERESIVPTIQPHAARGMVSLPPPFGVVGEGGTAGPPVPTGDPPPPINPVILNGRHWGNL